jgi:hypothetical protein
VADAVSRQTLNMHVRSTQGRRMIKHVRAHHEQHSSGEDGRAKSRMVHATE